MRDRKSSLGTNDRGVTLLVVAGGLVLMLGMCALSIDLVAGYLARVQCQRAADAAALAGARAFAANCTTTGCTAGSTAEMLASQNAISIAAQNSVMGLAPDSTTISTTFDYTHDVLASGGSGEPQITVTVYRDSLHNNPMPTFFAKIFGITSMDVSASATAEAFNPGGTGTNVGVGCVKPFLVPNCDPNFPVAAGSAEANPNCACGAANGGVSTGVLNGDCPVGTTPGYHMSYYVDPTTGDAVHPLDCVWDSTNSQCTPSSGDIGAPWVLHSNAVPSQWYTIAFTSQSGMAYSQYIRECAPRSVACQGTLNTLNGKKVGPTDAGVDCLIHSCGGGGCSGQCPATGVVNNLPDGLNNGQDYMCAPYALPGANAQASCPSATPTSPFTVIAGANNPYGYTAGQMFGATTGGSDSLANVVLYDGSTLAPGGSTVTVQGYMSLFFQDALHSSTTDTINAVVVQVGGCGTGGSGSTTPNVNSPGGGSFIPIRLIHN
ncbi:MAG TPA: pilus assembly protein TadG-related protein [Terriglobia bacterium]|nr:pilus assembly protein TadG-related protein [Terriglobia bacterium]